MEIIEKQVEKVKEVPADNYGYNYGRRDINGKANAGLTLGIIGTDVDVEGILTEMMENLMTTNPFSFKTSLLNLKLWIWYLICITLRVAESIVEKSLIYIRQRKFVKGIEE